ncbi:MAG: nucleotidyltransferase family protein [Oscillospiraceae bacterium]
MREEFIINNNQYLIHLLGSALEYTQPLEKPKELQWIDIFKLAEAHKVSNLAFYSVEKLNNKPSNDIYLKWKEIKEKSIVRSYTQLFERDRLIHLFEENQVRTLMLKGCYLMEMYPQEDFRFMSDLDFLVHKDDIKKAQSVLKQCGYSLDSAYDHHLEYIKPPIMVVELHNKLISLTCKYHDYYINPWERTYLKDGFNYIYEWSWNDYYIYMIVHMAKHYFSGGIGIRSIMDIHIFLSKHSNDLDYSYLNQEFKKLNLMNFVKDAEILAKDWFENQTYTCLSTMSKYILSCGIYGNLNNKVQNGLKLHNGSKLKYIFSRIFMPFNFMKERYPILQRLPFLLPFVWIYRVVFKMLTDFSRIKDELKYLK